MDELYAYRQRLLDRMCAEVEEFASWSEQISSMGSASSSQQVLVHLLETERRIFYPVIQRILYEEAPYLQIPDKPDPEPGALQGERSLPELLGAYTRLRSEEVQLLQAQPPMAWGRTGRHSLYGVRTLQWWVERSLRHVEEHLKEQPC